MSILYKFSCSDCGHEFEELVNRVADRDLLCNSPCPNCQDYGVRRVLCFGGFTVPEGGCGNAKNGYSSYHGDSEKFKNGNR